MADTRKSGIIVAVPVFTAVVTEPMPRPPLRPTTGYRYLDAVLDQPGALLAMAHRGGAGHPDLIGLENTAAAFCHAVDLGYEYLETDVHTTSDGTLLAFHDDVLDRVTDQRGAVADLTAQEAARARIGGVHPVPTMASLLEEFPDSRFNIDLKSAAAVAPLVELIERTGAHDRVLVGSFALGRLEDFRGRTQGRVATSATPVEVAAFLLAPSGRLAARFTRHRVAALQIPARRGRLRVVTPGLVRRAHAARCQVHVWTVDDPGEMVELIDLGVDGLITDRTDLLKAVLVQRGLWRDPR